VLSLNTAIARLKTCTFMEWQWCRLLLRLGGLEWVYVCNPTVLVLLVAIGGFWSTGDFSCYWKWDCKICVLCLQWMVKEVTGYGQRQWMLLNVASYCVEVHAVVIVVDGKDRS